MPHGQVFLCPGCHALFSPEPGAEPGLRCTHCGAVIKGSQLQFLFAAVLAFLASLGLTYALGLKAAAAPLWIVIYLGCLIASILTVNSIRSPLIVDKQPVKPTGIIERNLKLFLAWWFFSIVFVLCYGYVIAWVGVLVGATRRDILENMDMWSFPISLANPSFIIRPNTDLAFAIIILTTNCYFYALALLAVFRIVHGAMRRNRVTELGIGASTLDDDDDI